MGGADSWNESLQQFDDRAAMMAALRDDPYGIAYGGLAHAVPEVRTLPLSEGPGMPYVAATRKSVADRSYPLSRFAYIYAAPDTLVGDEANLKKDNPKLHEFLSYVLSRQGQAMVSREGDYLPLTADVAQEQLEKLD
jgi:phosphate transport system substrate-binding protein